MFSLIKVTSILEGDVILNVIYVNFNTVRYLNENFIFRNSSISVVKDSVNFTYHFNKGKVFSRKFYILKIG